MSTPAKGSYAELGLEIGQLVDKKNAAYGDSHAKSAAFLRLLYPNGITPENYEHALAIIRVFDKLSRLATNNDPFGENPWQDIAGYSMLALRRSPAAPRQAKQARPRWKVAGAALVALAAFLAATLLLSGCTVGHVTAEHNLCVSLGAGSCSYDAGSTDVRGQFISAEIAQAMAGIADGLAKLWRSIIGLP